MKADEDDIASIIEGQKQYNIPLFQRAYVWEKKHWQILWNDILDLYYSSREHNHNDNHFFGSFVTMPLKQKNGVKTFLLIDGQQRLTTLFVLLATLRNQAEKNDATKKIGEEIKQYLFNISDDSIKLLPTKLQGDKDCFEQIIRGEECSIAHNRIKDTFLFFTKSVAKESVDLKTLMRIITGALRVVHIELDEGDDPYKIFESLNAKGAELSQADLIRNYFFMKIGDEKPAEDIYDAYWKPMQQKLGDKYLSEYMRHFLMKDSAIIKKNEVYFTLKKRIDGQKTPADVVELLQDLAKFVGYYEKLLYPERERTQRIRERLFRLNQIGFTVAYPFLLNIYEDYSQQRISGNQLTEILNLIENFSVRRSICQLPTYRLNIIFPYLYEKSDKHDDFVEGVKIELSKQQYPSNSQFVDALKNAQLYDKYIKSRQKITLILERVESVENKKSVNVARHKNMTLEHIMPQELTLEWKKHLGEDHQSIHQTFVNTIGNLTLSDQKLAKLDFLQKQKCLKKSNLYLNRYFANLTKWDEEAIRQRAEALATIALKIWPYFGEVQTDFSAHDVKGKKPITVTIVSESSAVSSWRDVMQKTLETIIDIAPEVFDKIIDKFPQYVVWEDKFRSSRQLSNGAYIETNMDARSIYQFCRDVIKLSGLSSSDWQVEWIN
jgi:uncharacterized protein with ParB-like and HNH nuclease domain